VSPGKEPESKSKTRKVGIEVRKKKKEDEERVAPDANGIGNEWLRKRSGHE